MKSYQSYFIFFYYYLAVNFYNTLVKSDFLIWIINFNVYWTYVEILMVSTEPLYPTEPDPTEPA